MEGLCHYALLDVLDVDGVSRFVNTMKAYFQQLQNCVRLQIFLQSVERNKSSQENLWCGGSRTAVAMQMDDDHHLPKDRGHRLMESNRLNPERLALPTPSFQPSRGSGSLRCIGFLSAQFVVDAGVIKQVVAVVAIDDVAAAGGACAPLLSAMQPLVRIEIALASLTSAVSRRRFHGARMSTRALFSGASCAVPSASTSVC